MIEKEVIELQFLSFLNFEFLGFASINAKTESFQLFYFLKHIRSSAVVVGRFPVSVI
jgi:hypothetical protein